MSICKIIMVTSCKGGVGKSTVAANLGTKLASLGRRTLVLDCDFGVRSLDLIMGMENDIIYDISDVILRSIPFEKAMVQDKKVDELYFCAAPYTYNNDISEQQFKDTVLDIADNAGFEYMIIDTPGELGDPIKFAASVSQLALIISTYQPASLRAAERTGMILQEMGVDTRKLIVNCFEAANAGTAVQPGILDIIDKTCIQLIGIIPYDTALAEYQARGESVFGAKASNSAVAFGNIADRICGHNVPLFSGFYKTKRRKLLKKIQ